MFKILFKIRDVQINKEVRDIIKPRNEALKVSLIYLLLGIAWIKVSDKLLETLTYSSKLYWTIQTYKGWIYVVITTFILYGLIVNKILLLQKAFSELNKSNEKLDILAYYDTLTGLPNRSLFNLKVDELINRNFKRKTKFALIYMDIDDFKNINNTLGHALGDKLIIYISDILKQHIRENDFVSRFGSDEFIIIFANVENNKKIVEKLEHLLVLIKSPWVLGDQEFYITYSMGIAIYDEDGKDLNELLKNANTAMFEAKSKNKNCFIFYNDDMEKKVKEKINMINEMRNAINKNEFMLYYQPIVGLKDSTILGFEALIRWNHSKKGFIPPMEFIPLSEDTGYIDQITKWVLKTVCEQIKDWSTRGMEDLVLGVNISGKLLINDDLVDYIKKLLDFYNIKGDRIKLEITETAIMTDLQGSVEVLKKIRALGLKISLDDFGTGYSSLTYLKKLPINMVKLDKGFIDNIFLNKEDKIVVKSVIRLIQDLNLKVIVEGIETKEQLDFFKDNDCDFGQGYYFSKPVPTEQCEEITLKFSRVQDLL